MPPTHWLAFFAASALLLLIPGADHPDGHRAFAVARTPRRGRGAGHRTQAAQTTRATRVSMRRNSPSTKRMNSASNCAG